MNAKGFPPPIPEGALILKCPHCGGEIGTWCVGAGGGGGSDRMKELADALADLWTRAEDSPTVSSDDIRRVVKPLLHMEDRDGK